MNDQTFSRSRTPSVEAERAEDILSRYPDIGERELSTLIAEIPRLPILDFALMTADERLARKLEAFNRDHGHKLKKSWASAAVFLFVPVCLVLAIVWWAVHQMVVG